MADFPETDSYSSGIVTYHVSSQFPFLLIKQSTDFFGSSYFISLQSIEEKKFNADEYDIDEPPNSNPHTKFNYTVDNLSVIFDASNSYDSDGQITSYEWNFDDETNGTGKIITHEYKSSGKYHVKLYVYDDEDGRGVKWTYVEVNASSADTGDEVTTPGFELIFVLVGILFILFRKRRRIN